MTFAERLNPSVQFERQVIAKLNASGWHAFHFGQGQLPPECRDRLSRFEDMSGRPCRIRWMPDIITFRDLRGGRSKVALIDAKVCDGPRYAVETAAVDTTEVYVDGLFTPTFFVFDDWKVLTPLEVRHRGFQGPHKGNGSGTAYLLVDKRYGRPFSGVFAPSATARAPASQAVEGAAP